MPLIDITYLSKMAETNLKTYGVYKSIMVKLINGFCFKLNL